MTNIKVVKNEDKPETTEILAEMRDRNYVLAKPLLDKNIETKKIPLSEVQKWFTENKGIPTRTFQWYVQEGLIPSPEFDGRNGYYNSDQFQVLVESVDILRYIKQCAKSQYGVWRKVIRKHKDNLRKLLDKALILPEEYPISYYDDDLQQPFHNHENEAICMKVLQKLQDGLDEVSIIDISDRSYW